MIGETMYFKSPPVCMRTLPDGLWRRYSLGHEGFAVYVDDWFVMTCQLLDETLDRWGILAPEEPEMPTAPL